MSDVGFIEIISIDVYQYNLADVAWNPFGKTGEVEDYSVSYIS